MARDYDDMEDDNPINEDFDNNSDECPVCGELKNPEHDYCSEECYLLAQQSERV